MKKIMNLTMKYKADNVYEVELMGQNCTDTSCDIIVNDEDFIEISPDKIEQIINVIKGE